VDSSTLLPEYKGVGMLRGLPNSDAAPTTRTYLADAEDAEKILVAARAYRERAGTLCGMAAGESAEVARRDVPHDAESVFYAGRAWISWQRLAARLADAVPAAYADVTAEAVSAELRAAGVASVNGKQDGQVLKGAKLTDIREAIHRRELTGR